MTTELGERPVKEIEAKVSELVSALNRAGMLDAKAKSALDGVLASIRSPGKTSADGGSDGRGGRPNYTYVECKRRNRKGKSTCRKRRREWSFCIIPGCTELVEDAPKFLKEAAK